MIITELLWINLIVTLIFLSGFVDSIDEAINKRLPFHHLPKPFSCNLCMVFWISLIWVLIQGQLTLLNIALCLINAHLTEITSPLLIVIKEWGKKIISWIMPR